MNAKSFTITELGAKDFEKWRKFNDYGALHNNGRAIIVGRQRPAIGNAPRNTSTTKLKKQEKMVSKTSISRPLAE